MLDSLPAREPTSRLSCQIIWDKHLDGLEVTLRGSLTAMRYFPLFADLENADVLVAGGGEQAAQKVRLLRKTGARITVVAETRHRRAARARATQRAIWIVLRAFLAARSRGPAPGLCRHRRPRCWMPPSRARPRRAAFPSTSSMRPSSPPSSRRPSSTALPSRWRSAPKAPRPCWRARSRPGSRRWLPANLGSARRSARRRCATVVARPSPTPRARRRLWERLLQGPFRRAVLSGAEAEAGRILAAELHGASRADARAAWR